MCAPSADGMEEKLMNLPINACKASKKELKRSLGINLWNRSVDGHSQIENLKFPQSSVRNFHILRHVQSCFASFV